jgi:uncharacterized tellurite resistance protein B-like protein
MEELKYEKLLFNTAVCVMACDGQIHENEVNELNSIASTTPYFGKLDYKNELNMIMKKIKKNVNIMKLYFNNIQQADLSLAQELLILEVVLRIMYSDNRIDENEIKFIKLLKSYLKIPDQVIFERFGKIDFLIKGVEDINQQKFTDEFKNIQFFDVITKDK